MHIKNIILGIFLSGACVQNVSAMQPEESYESRVQAWLNGCDDNVYALLQDQEYNFDRVANLANQIIDGGYDKQGVAINLYLSLIEEGYSPVYCQAACVAQKLSDAVVPELLNSDDYELSFRHEIAVDTYSRNITNALCMYGLLVKQGHKAIYEKAINLVQKSMHNHKLEYWVARLMLYTILIGQGCQTIYSNALLAAEQGLKSTHEQVQFLALKIYAALVKQGYEKVYDQAVIIAEKGLANTSFTLERTAPLKIYRMLVLQGYHKIYDRAVLIAKQELLSWQDSSAYYRGDVVIEVLKLYQVLQAKGQAVDTAQQVFDAFVGEVQKGLTSIDTQDKEIYLRMCTILVQQGLSQMYERAAREVQECTQEISWAFDNEFFRIRKAAKKLKKVLFTRSL